MATTVADVYNLSCTSRLQRMSYRKKSGALRGRYESDNGIRPEE